MIGWQTKVAVRPEACATWNSSKFIYLFLNFYSNLACRRSISGAWTPKSTMHQSFCRNRRTCVCTPCHPEHQLLPDLAQWPPSCARTHFQRRIWLRRPSFWQRNLFCGVPLVCDPLLRGRGWDHTNRPTPSCFCHGDGVGAKSAHLCGTGFSGKFDTLGAGWNGTERFDRNCSDFFPFSVIGFLEDIHVEMKLVGQECDWLQQVENQCQRRGERGRLHLTNVFYFKNKIIIFINFWQAFYVTRLDAIRLNSHNLRLGLHGTRVSSFFRILEEGIQESPKRPTVLEQEVPQAMGATDQEVSMAANLAKCNLEMNWTNCLWSFFKFCCLLINDKLNL